MTASRVGIVPISWRSGNRLQELRWTEGQKHRIDGRFTAATRAPVHNDNPDAMAISDATIECACRRDFAMIQPKLIANYDEGSECGRRGLNCFCHASLLLLGPHCRWSRE
jgi:hypothetical protein